MAQRIDYCEVCKSSSNMRHRSGLSIEGSQGWCECNTCKSRGNYYIKESDHKSEIGAKNSEIGAKNSKIAGKDCEIRNLKSEMSQSEIKAKEILENLRDQKF